MDAQTITVIIVVTFMMLIVVLILVETLTRGTIVFERDSEGRITAIHRL